MSACQPSAGRNPRKDIAAAMTRSTTEIQAGAATPGNAPTGEMTGEMI
jgi:hypothetical protein